MDYLNKYAAIFERICEHIEPGKKMIQKLMYLMERKGIDLDLNYSIHFFGPYSSKLDGALHMLESKDIINIDTSGMTHKISMGEVAPHKGEIAKVEDQIINEILGEFSNKSALELEAITTLDYVATSLLSDQASDKEIVDGVKKIKGSKFTEEYLSTELQLLKQYGFLN